MGTELCKRPFRWGFCPFGDGMNVHSAVHRERTGHYVLVDFFSLKPGNGKKGVHVFGESRKKK